MLNQTQKNAKQTNSHEVQQTLMHKVASSLGFGACAEGIGASFPHVEWLSEIENQFSTAT
jgi:hypothetical protein